MRPVFFVVGDTTFTHMKGHDMKCLAGAALAIILTQAAQAQLTMCSLNQLPEQIGDCTACPTVEEPYNCTEEEITYDAWCDGACLFGRQCKPSETEYREVYVLRVCISDCDDPYFPECSRAPDNVQVLNGYVPSACGCTTEA